MLLMMQQLHMRGVKNLVLCLALICSISAITCHYSCPGGCTTSDYYRCTVCGPNRGIAGQPIYGMCYCSQGSDEDSQGVCQDSSAYNSLNKGMITFFICFTMLLGIFSIFVKGMKYFFFKTIEDVQELSLIVFINLYFPQQFDSFLATLYRFNLSSSTFQNMAAGTLFTVQPDSSLATVDAQNIYGKYKLLGKTANFFSNQFTWIIVFFSLFTLALIVRWLRNHLKNKKQFQLVRSRMRPAEESIVQMGNTQSEMQIQTLQIQQQKTAKRDLFWVLTRLHNALWFNFLIVFFYFSLVQLNINIFTQVFNLTFSSTFATVGPFFSAVFLALQLVVLVLLLLKAREEMVKPEWMRDHSFTPTLYLIRTNFKSVTKYFWFFSCLKKALLALMLTVFYEQPLNAIIGVSAVHASYLALAVYCEPYERKYIRLHFYITEGMKMFMFLSLVNFAGEYAEQVNLISLTMIFYGLMAFIFSLHFLFLLVHLCCERKVYRHFLRRKFCDEQHPEVSLEKVGYRAREFVYIYVKE